MSPRGSLLLILISGWAWSCSSHGRLPGEEPRKWPIEATIGQFVIRCNFDVAASELPADELNQIVSDVEQLLSIRPTDQEIHVVLFDRRSEYVRYMQTYFPNLPQRRALFIQDRGPGMLFTYWHREVTTDLRHEITHALLNQTSGRLPLWLDEGLAEYFEVEPSDRYLEHEHLPAIASQLTGGWMPALESLEDIENLQQFGDRQYRDSWAWVHFLLHRNPATRQLLIDYLRRSRSGASQLPLSRQLVMQLPNYADAFRAHFAQLSSERRQRPPVQPQ